MVKKYICVHGHFYQPPRENPWLEEIEVQDSASPYHDWNERINRECYAPNTASRALRADGRIEGIVNNFEKISFNIGPTLFAWLESRDPETYLRIIDADRASMAARSGHGSAMAQAYNHMIMPLATPRDRETQVKWGIADFVHRFDRRPEGMWLPETAVDTATLRIMADNGIKFTVLSQGQAKAVREAPEGKMTPLSSGIDPTRAYKASLGDGRYMTVFFYDGPISQAVAFEGLLESGDKFAARLKSGYSETRKWNQLLNIATDGETYGHHHRFGEMALTYALGAFEKSADTTLTNYAEYMSLHPPKAEVEVLENSSWSCAHGVERWKSDCGCSLGTKGWNQKWRAPLRGALDKLKSEFDRIFEEAGSRYFKDPWETRNDYIKVILDRRWDRALDFLAEHQKRGLSPTERVTAMRLLETQRNGMLMYTSCGWFFDDVSGIETIQVLKYAARAMQLYEEVTGENLEEGFLKDLGAARSNIPQQGGADDVYRRHVLPEKATLARVLANQAISSALNSNRVVGEGVAFDTVEMDKERDEYGETAFIVARAKIRSKVTLEEQSMAIATLKLGGADVTCFTKQDADMEKYEKMVIELFDVWRQRSLTELIRKLDSVFGEMNFTLKDLFMERRRQAVNVVFEDHIRRFVDTYDQLFWRNRGMMDYFVEADVPIPPEFKLAAQYVLERELRQEVERVYEPQAAEKLAELMGEARKWDVDLNLRAARKELEKRLRRMLEKIIHERDIDAVRMVTQTVLVAQATEFGLDLWSLQNQFITVHKARMKTPDDPFFGHSEFTKLGILLNFAYKEKKSP